MLLKTFPIEFVRQALEQTLFEQHLANPSLFFGGREQVSLISFYQQLKNQDEVNRFVTCFEDIAKQQNRTGLIGNGIILSPENPTITNLYSCTIIPMTFTCAMRVQLSNRDQMLETINNMIDELKGAKCDIAQLSCVDANGHRFAVPFVVGTIGHNEGKPALVSGNYIGDITQLSEIPSIITNLASKGVDTTNFIQKWFYVGHEGKIKPVKFYAPQSIWYFPQNTAENKDVIFPPEHTAFDKYKLSISFESLRCDTPHSLNGNEYCEISFGGSATLQDANVLFGNDIIKIGVSKYGYKASTDVAYTNPRVYYLEPLELPSGNNINTLPVQLASNNFNTNSHNDAISITLQYTFVADMSHKILKQWYKYGRYGVINVDSSSDENAMNPNLIYNVTEFTSYWGNFENDTFKAKIVGDIDIENTEGDTMTIAITMQKQGDNS